MIKKVIACATAFLMAAVSYAAEYKTLKVLGHELSVYRYTCHGTDCAFSRSDIDIGISTSTHILTMKLDKKIKNRVWVVMTEPNNTTKHIKSTKYAFSVDCKSYRVKVVYTSTHPDYFANGSPFAVNAFEGPYQVVAPNTPSEVVANLVCENPD